MAKHSKWITHVMKIYRRNKSKKGYKLSHAMSEGKRTYKKKR